MPLLFLSWFCIPAGSVTAEGAVAVVPERCWNAWTSFGTIDLILFFTAVLAIGVAVAAMFRVPLPVLPGPVLTVAGGLAFLLVAYRLINPPWDGAGRAAAPFFALLCLAAISSGGVLSRRIRTAHRTAGGKPGAARRAGRDTGPGHNRPSGRSGGSKPYRTGERAEAARRSWPAGGGAGRRAAVRNSRVENRGSTGFGFNDFNGKGRTD